MKSLFFTSLVLVAIFLVACGQGGPGLGSANCAEGVCVTLRVVEPVQYNQPVVVIITVTSEQDRSDLGLTLYTDAIQATIDGPQGWESPIHNGRVFKYGPSDGAGWFFDAKANVPVHFTRVFHFPDKDQYFGIDVALHVPPRSYVAFAHAGIMYRRTGVQVYGMGTRVPGSQPEPISTWSPWLLVNGTRVPAPTPLPTPTFAERPRSTRTPTRRSYP